MTRAAGWFWAMVFGVVIWTLIFLAVGSVRADDRCQQSITSQSSPLATIPRYAAMAGIQMDLNVNSLQVGAAATNGGHALAAGKRYCFSADKCGFFGLNIGLDNIGESYTVSTTWVLR